MQKHSFCIASIANRDHPLEIMNSIANHDRQPPPTSTGPHSPNHQRLIYLWLSGELQLQKTTTNNAYGTCHVRCPASYGPTRDGFATLAR